MAKQWFWLSFSGPSGSKGVSCVMGEDPSDAIRESWDHALNPGGEVLIIRLKEPPPPELQYQLVGGGKVMELGLGGPCRVEMGKLEGNGPSSIN